MTSSKITGPRHQCCRTMGKEHQLCASKVCWCRPEVLGKMGDIIRYDQWMTQLPQWIAEVPISSLAIPGSHDSATSDLDPSLGVAAGQSGAVKFFGNSCCGKRTVSRWSKTQNMSVSEQLKIGVRYFDFRVAVHPETGEFRFVHGFYAGEVGPILMDIKQFLDDNPFEIVILDFNHFYNVTQMQHSLLLTDIRSIFQYKLVPPPFSSSTYKMWGTSLRTLWQTPYRVIVLYHDPESIGPFPEVWSGRQIESPWANTDNVRNLINFLEDNYSTKHRLMNDTFYSWQGVLTPTAKDIVLHPGSGLEQRLASKASQAFVKWLDTKIPGPQEINICNADFVEKHNFVPTVVGLNTRIRQIPPKF